MIQKTLTTAAGKRLIAKAVPRHPAVQAALQAGTVVVIAGTTNGYVAEELLAAVGQAEAFSRDRFFRGITLPPGRKVTDLGRLADHDGKFPGDVVLVKGQLQPGQTIFDVAGDLQEGDVVMKGANALDLARRQAGVLIGHPQGGTILATLPAVIGRRAKLLVPVGLEKRIPGDLNEVAARLNEPGTPGPRMMPMPGEVLTELEAVQLLSGAVAELVAAGGVGGAEGAMWLAVCGTPEQEATAAEVLDSVIAEPPFGA